MKTLKIGDTVSVKMTYSKTELVSVNGVLKTKKTGEFVKHVADEIVAIYDNGFVFCNRCHFVSSDDIIPANEQQVNDLAAKKNRVIDMLNNGDKLMSTLVEPEFI
ncbi:MAG: hypothetical protein WCS28_12255 [Thiomicrospira sp.]